MTNLGVVITEKEKEHFKGRGPLPEDWYKTSNFVSDKENEPTPYKLFFDFMIGGALMGGLEGAMTQSGSSDVMGKMLGMFTKLPPFTLLIESSHPKRGLEYVRINMSPFGIKEGAPEVGSKEEPELIMSIDYYDLVRLITGELNFIDPFCDGLATIDGDMGVFMQFENVFGVFEAMFGMGDGVIMDE